MREREKDRARECTCSGSRGLIVDRDEIKRMIKRETARKSLSLQVETDQESEKEKKREKDKDKERERQRMHLPRTKRVKRR